jgi:CheY-like chemotaxis protein
VDGEDAINKFIGHKDDIRLCILDMIMPKKNGMEACKEIRKMRPDIKVLFASGYTADIIQKKGIIEEGFEYIQKPISPNDFLREVRAILDK